jgi:hypothetical protein
MAHLEWEITGACDKIFYAPDERCVLSIGISNRSKSTATKISHLVFASDFGNVPLAGPDIVTLSNRYGSARYEILIPRNVWGERLFALEYRMHYYGQNSWRLGGYFASNRNTYFINILPQRQINTSRYKIFVSRSIRDKDRPIGDFIAQRLRQWNLETRTVGIEVYATKSDTARTIKKEIRNADGVVAIATPRNYDQITDTWRTLDWLYSETGIAYGIDKPLLVLRESSVQLNALPQYLNSFENIPNFDFSRNNLNKLIYDIDYHIPYYRESVKKERVDRFYSNLLTGGIVFLAGYGLGDILRNAANGFGWTEKKENVL